MRAPLRLLTALMTASIATAGIAVGPVFAAAPLAVDDTDIFVNEDAVAYPIDVLNNDSDPDGDPLTITAKTDGTIGTVAIAGDNFSVTYTPEAENSGPDSFTYTISDGQGGSDTATVSLTVVALNDAPSFTLGADPTVFEDSGTHTFIGYAVGSVGPPVESEQVISYVIDSNTNTGLFTALGGPAIASNGDLTFTLAANANGSATITVHAVDNGPNGGGDVNFSPTQNFIITVTPVNDAPVAVADGPYTMHQGANSVPVGTGVLANDTDIDTAHNVLTAVLNVDVTHGTLALNANGSFTYTPTAAYVGADSFTYHADDGPLNSNIVTVSLTVTLNNAPVAVDDAVTVVSGSGYTPIDVLTNDTDPNGDVLDITAVSNPPHGSAIITGGGTGVSYRPDTNFFGTDSFTYTISDGFLTDSATVSVTVPKDTFKPVATAPVQTFSPQTIGTSTVKVRLTWTGTDQGSGINRFELWRSTNGGTYTRILTTVGHQAYVTLTPANTYRFRVRAIDNKGNVGVMAYGPSFTAYRYQETSSSIVYASPWQNLTSVVYSGGKAKSTTVNGNEATFTTLARTIAFVTTKSTNRGTAAVYVDGVLKANLTLTSSSAKYRYLAYSITFATSGVHSMRIVYTGASSKRVDVDAFVFLR